MGKAEWGGSPVYWWLGLYFCFVCCLDEVSCTGCYWWLGDARSCIQVVSLVWVLTIWYSLGLVLWQCRVWEKAMAPHSSTVAWKIPWMEEPGGLQSMGSLSQTWLSDFTFTFHFHALEKEMQTHSSVLAWRIPWMEKPGRLQYMGSHRVRHDWSDLAAAAAAAV